VIELKGHEPAASITNGDNLSVGCGVIARSDLVAASPDNFVPLNDHCAKRPSFAVAHHINRKPNGFPHVVLVHGKSSPALVRRESCRPWSRTFRGLPWVHRVRR